MTIFEACKQYNAIATDELKAQFINSNIKITPYVPFIVKDTLINKLFKISMYDKKTKNIKVNSSVEFILYTRMLIEQYTDLTIETEGFFEEYDELKKSGLFTVLFGDFNTNTPPLIPIEEIEEFNNLIAMKRKDIITNEYELHAFINERMNRFMDVMKVLQPISDEVFTRLNETETDENVEDFKEVEETV